MMHPEVEYIFLGSEIFQFYHEIYKWLQNDFMVFFLSSVLIIYDKIKI